jgi:hypothetical protein
MSRVEEVAAALRRSEERLASATWPSDEALERAVADNFAAQTRGLSDGELDQLDRMTLLDGMEALAARVQELEARAASFDLDAGDGSPPMRWGGFFDAERSYRPGDVCAFRDSLWVCERKQTAVRPAGRDSGWRLVMKAPYDRRPSAGDR